MLAQFWFCQTCCHNCVGILSHKTTIASNSIKWLSSATKKIYVGKKWMLFFRGFDTASVAFEDMIAIALHCLALVFQIQFNANQIKWMCVQNSRRKRKVLLTSNEVQTKRKRLMEKSEKLFVILRFDYQVLSPPPHFFLFIFEATLWAASVFNKNFNSFTFPSRIALLLS